MLCWSITCLLYLMHSLFLPCSVLGFFFGGGGCREDLFRLPFQTAMSAGFVSVEGIWRAKGKKSEYFSLHSFLGSSCILSLGPGHIKQCLPQCFQLLWGNLSCGLSFCWVVSRFGFGKPTVSSNPEGKFDFLLLLILGLPHFPCLAS